MPRSFHAEAVKGYTVKVIIDVLSGFLQRSTIHLSRDGIFIRANDRNEVIFFNICLLREKFMKYKCAEPRSISLNFKHLQALMKNVKKKDTVVLFIDDTKKPGNLGISIKQDRAQKNETNYIVFQDESVIEELTPPGSEHYTYPMVIDGTDFQKVKKLSTINNRELEVRIQQSNYIQFSADAVVRSSEVSFGKLTMDLEVEGTDEGTDGTSDDDNEISESSDGTSSDGSEKEYPNVYDGLFSSQTFNSLIKLPGLCTQMQFYAPNMSGMPLKIKVNAGQLGEIEIYIKDLAQIAYEESMRKEQH